MNNKISCIAHLGDIHIRKLPTRNAEYQNVFNNLLKSLSEKKPDRIVIVGDLVHDYLDLQGEQLIMANNFLKSLCDIAPVRITRGNHDFRKKNLKRVDSVKAIVETLGDVDIKYYDEEEDEYNQPKKYYEQRGSNKKYNYYDNYDERPIKGGKNIQYKKMLRKIKQKN